MRKKIAIVTGASGGIGKEFMRLLALEGLDEVWAISRSWGKLECLKRELSEKVVPIPKDLTRMSELHEIEALLQECNPMVMYLVNNAGMSKMGSYEDFSVEEIDKTVNLNCKAPVILCKLCIPYMTRGSRILMISSASAFQPNPYINLYAATKVFERSYARALHVELKSKGITVTAVCPCWVDTEMLPKEINGKKVKFPGIVSARRVAIQALKDAEKGKDMSVCSLYVKCLHLNVKFMPQKWAMKLWMKSIKKYI